MPGAEPRRGADPRRRRLGWLLAAPLLLLGGLAAVILVGFLVSAGQRQLAGEPFAWPEVSDLSDLSDLPWPDLFAADISGRVTRVVDGDTLVLVADGRTHRVRLYGIDAPELDQPWGRQARRALVRKVRGHIVAIDVVDVDAYDRLVGRVRVGDVDVNRAMLREGHAWVYRQFTMSPSFYLDEMNAKSEHAGLWRRSDPEPPWDWRHEH